MNWLNDKGKRDGKLLKALGALRPFIEAGMRKRNELYAPEPEVEEQGLTARRQKRNTNKNPFRSVDSYLGYKVRGVFEICEGESDILTYWCRSRLTEYVSIDDGIMLLLYGL